MSAIVPPPTTSGAAPAQPAMKRKMNNIGSEVARAQAMVDKTNKILLRWRIIVRPHTSEAGAKPLGLMLVSSNQGVSSYMGPIALPKM